MNELKLVILGDGAVGKTAITVQFIQNHFVNIYDPTIEDCYRKQAEIDGSIYLLDILDTAGQEEYSAMRDQYMRSGEGFLLVYDITNRQTFEEVIKFKEQIDRIKEKDIILILCGNKLDLNMKRQVSIQEGKNLADNFGCKFFECSAKQRINIDEVWHQLVREVMKHRNSLIKKYWKKKREKCLIL